MSDIIHEDDQQITFSTGHRLRQALEHYKIFCRLPADKVTMPKTARISPYTQFNICFSLHTMGVGSYTMGATSLIEVGAYCSLAGGMIVLGERHPIEDTTSSSLLYNYRHPNFHALYRDHRVDPERLTPDVPAYGAQPVIQHDVWVGQNVTLARGITLGTGCVVAGGALVVKDVEPYTIVGGNPARVIRKRFDDVTCKRLLASEWWNIDPTDLLQWLKLRDPNIFLAEIAMVSKAGNLRNHSFTPVTADMLASFMRNPESTT